MLLEFPSDPGCDYLDRQYMLGDSLLVAPVFTYDQTVDYYLPEGTWTNFLTTQKIQGGGWRKEKHDFFSLPRFAFSDSYGDMERFRRAVSALPLPLSDLTPADPLLVRNPPAIGFTLAANMEGSDRLACFASHESGKARLERLGARRVEVRIETPFPPGRGRVNCTAPGPEGRWRWFSMQFYIPAP